MSKPAPYDWHDVSKHLPPVDETVKVKGGLFFWAYWTGKQWKAMDSCGNRMELAWQPEYWRREYFPQEPA